MKYYSACVRSSEEKRNLFSPSALRILVARCASMCLYSMSHLDALDPSCSDTC